MKIRSEIHAGAYSYEACRRDVEAWKSKAHAMERYAKTCGGGYVPVPPNPPPPIPPYPLQ
jgi:hypothetical protein